MKTTYTQLKFEERFVIEKLWDAKSYIREIARFLGRSPGTISREIRNNSVRGVYTAQRSEEKVRAKRWRAKRQCLKVSLDSFLTTFVTAQVEQKWSPRQISGYLNRELGIQCSQKAIYKFVESRGLECHLFWRWNKKKGGRKHATHATAHDGRKYIDTRPPIQGEYGHYEVDFIVSKESAFVLMVVVECLTRHTQVLRLPNRKRSTIRAAFLKVFSGISVKSITTDNDIAFTAWQELETMIQAPIYFCHPYHSWEKGLVENTNRWIRCFVPKRRDILTVTQEDLDQIHAFLNDRPREVIGFRSPREYYQELTGVLLEG